MSVMQPVVLSPTVLNELLDVKRHAAVGNMGSSPMQYARVRPCCVRQCPHQYA